MCIVRSAYLEKNINVNTALSMRNYAEWVEGPTKTRQGGLLRRPRSVSHFTQAEGLEKRLKGYTKQTYLHWSGSLHELIRLLRACTKIYFSTF